MALAELRERTFLIEASAEQPFIASASEPLMLNVFTFALVTRQGITRKSRPC